MIIPPTRLRQHQRVLRQIEGVKVKFSFHKGVLGKSPVIPVCLSESCLSHDVTRALILNLNNHLKERFFFVSFFGRSTKCTHISVSTGEILASPES